MRFSLRQLKEVLWPAAVTTVLLLGLADPPSAGAAANPTTCEGYPQPRVFVESQSWWSDLDTLPFGGDMEHVHAGTCFPMDRIVSGNVTLEVVVKMHNQQGQSVKRVRVDVASDQGGNRRYETLPAGLRCDVADCTFVVPVTVRTNEQAAGKWEWRVGVETRPVLTSVRDTNLATNGWQTCVRSCSGRTPQNDRKEGRGWYRDTRNEAIGYEVASFGWLAEHDAEYPWRNGAFQPVSGLWQPPVSLKAGAQEGRIEPHEWSQAYVDPNFHAGSEGIRLLNQAGPFKGRLAIDTTQLPNGIHKLVLISSTRNTFVGDLRGVHVVPFLVKNQPPPEG